MSLILKNRNQWLIHILCIKWSKHTKHVMIQHDCLWCALCICGLWYTIDFVFFSCNWCIDDCNLMNLRKINIHTC